MISFVSIKVLITLMDGKLHPAQELADANEVSVKTIQRAVLSLESAGVFVASKKGRFGGYYLEKSSIPHLSCLSPLELGELMSICKLKESVLPSSTEFSWMQGAIINSTAEKNISTVLSTSSKIIFDSLPWHKHEISNQKFDKVYAACQNSKALKIEYISYSGTLSKRTIFPYCLTLKDGSWYTYAKDDGDQKMKLFKLSRFSKIETTQMSFVPDPTIALHDKPWNNQSSFKHTKIKVKIQNSKLSETLEWLNFTPLEQTSDYTIAEACVPDTIGFYYKLIEESKNVTLLSPFEMIQNLVSLCNDVKKNYSFV